MDCLKAKNLTNTLASIPEPLKYEDQTDFVKEYRTAATIILGLTLVFLIIFNKSVHKSARYKKDNISKNAESCIHFVSFFEIVQVLRQHKFGNKISIN